MAKNITIISLVLVIVMLIGIIIITNYYWFSQEGLIGIGMTIGSMAGLGILIYAKIRR